MNHQKLQGRVRIAQILLLLILVGGTVHVTDTVVGGTLFSDPFQLTVELEGAAGLHPKSTVNYRGQRIGVVTDVHLSDTGVVADLAIDEGVELPTDSEFWVRNLSAVGEQYVDVRPRTDQGPWLADGDVVVQTDTALPIPTHQVLASTQSLMRRIDVRDLETIADETETIFGDGSVDLRGLSVEMERSFALLQELQPDLLRLVRRGRVPLRTGVDLEAQLRGFARDVRLVARELRKADPVVRDVLADGAVLMPLARDFWRATSPVLSQLLQFSLPVTAMAAQHLPGLHVWLDWVPLQAQAMAGSTRGGSGRVLLVPKIIENCIYTDAQRDPYQLERTPLKVDARCTTEKAGIQHRGAQNVPRP